MEHSGGIFYTVPQKDTRGMEPLLSRWYPFNDALQGSTFFPWASHFLTVLPGSTPESLSWGRASRRTHPGHQQSTVSATYSLGPSLRRCLPWSPLKSHIYLHMTTTWYKALMEHRLSVFLSYYTVCHLHSYCLAQHLAYSRYWLNVGNISSPLCYFVPGNSSENKISWPLSTPGIPQPSLFCCSHSYHSLL